MGVFMEPQRSHCSGGAVWTQRHRLFGSPATPHSCANERFWIDRCARTTCITVHWSTFILRAWRLARSNPHTYERLAPFGAPCNLWARRRTWKGDACRVARGQSQQKQSASCRASV